MGLATAALLFGLGIAMLWGGAEWLVRGSAALGRLLGLSDLVVGLTIVALATSSPELLVSLFAAVVRGSVNLAVGNVVGSNIANVGLVLGLSALVGTIPRLRGLLGRELPCMLGVTLAFAALAYAGRRLGRLDGVLLLLLLALVMIWMVRAAGREAGKETENGAPAPPALAVSLLKGLVGLAVLLGGAELMTRSGVAMARLFSVDEAIIGLTLVALGTSLPELAASVVSVMRGNPEIAVGNVVGSNLFNLTFVAGTVAIVRPLDVLGRIITFDLPVMVALAIVMLALMAGGGLGRGKAILLLAVYVGYIVWLVVAA